uniref:Uncharacterized protein n=1 Tax=Amorphochlora amoebiformis TaxID=1561963 RepID=A0A0H5BLL7_9EUKA|nr:hypothetical protein [Amorphochlora amoebiformis]
MPDIRKCITFSSRKKMNFYQKIVINETLKDHKMNAKIEIYKSIYRVIFFHRSTFLYVYYFIDTYFSNIIKPLLNKSDLRLCKVLLNTNPNILNNKYYSIRKQLNKHIRFFSNALTIY